MTVHLSARLTWHDGAWNGRVCADPLANVYCVAHDHIRDSRDDAAEVTHAGLLLSDTEFRPPCSRDPGAYSSIGYRVHHEDPLTWRSLGAVDEDLGAYSIATSPYRRMLGGATTWENDPAEQLKRLSGFWDDLNPGRSLVLYYLKDGQPFIEGSQRVLVGIGRLAKIGPQLYFGGPADENGNRFPLWSRAITQRFPDEGVRIPLQEYARGGLDSNAILCLVPDALVEQFSYVAEQVSDDAAITMIERALQSVRAVASEGLVPGDWARQIAWLDKVLGEVWQDRGPHPGLASVLDYLGCTTAVQFCRHVLGPLINRGEDPWGVVGAILEGRQPAGPPPHIASLIKAGTTWRGEPEPRRQLLRLLSRTSVTSEQVARLVHPTKRVEAGLPADEATIIDNPYLLTELDLGTRDSPPISFDSVDHALLPAPGVAPSDEPISVLDDRRVRALISQVLDAAKRDGDTLLPLDDACRRAEKLTVHDRRCLPDPVRLQSSRTFFEEQLTFISTGARELVALRPLADDEAAVRARLSMMVTKSHDVRPLDWQAILTDVLKDSAQHASDDEARARSEKADALSRAIKSRLCVITGRAGTGKTTVARALIEGIHQLDGQTSLLLLAPTGKARIRLQETARREAKTIHQFLAENAWISFDYNYALRRDGGTLAGAKTVLIDEASMIPVDLFAALVRAIRWNDVSRLILLGDANQLPPIGPGRPFADLIGWLDADPTRRERLVRLEARGRFEQADSLALALSDGFASGDVPPGDDEVLARVARRDLDPAGDLEVHYWRDAAELHAVLSQRMRELVLVGDDKDAYQSLDGSFRRPDGSAAPEAWQILSPLRRQPFGTDETNRRIQLHYRRGALDMARRRTSFAAHQIARPAGDQQIVRHDKVIQLKNENRWSYNKVDKSRGKRYVANGEVGLVTWTERANSRERISVEFGTQRDTNFDYPTSVVDETLELAYAITVHKAQGSDFEVVFLILPQQAATLSRELVYTALTRFKKRLVLLLEHDIRPLERYRSPEQSETLHRNTNLFSLAIRPESVGFPHPENLIHRTATNILVRSKSEVIVADTLTRLGIDYRYEERLFARADERDFRLPDFTVTYEGDTWYWEHLGMLSIPSYAQAWERKKQWYQDSGLLDRVLTSEDGPDGSIDVPRIEMSARKRILGEHV